MLSSVFILCSQAQIPHIPLNWDMDISLGFLLWEWVGWSIFPFLLPASNSPPPLPSKDLRQNRNTMTKTLRGSVNQEKVCRDCVSRVENHTVSRVENCTAASLIK